MSTAIARAMPLLAALLVAVVLGGCAGKHSGAVAVGSYARSVHISPGVREVLATSEAPVEIESDARFYCTQIVPTGSHLPVLYCRTLAEYDAEQGIIR